MLCPVFLDVKSCLTVLQNCNMNKFNINKKSSYYIQLSQVLHLKGNPNHFRVQTDVREGPPEDSMSKLKRKS